MKVNRLSLPFLQLGLGHPFVVFGFIFDDRYLQRLANLRGRETHSWRIPHCLPHMPNQVLDGIGNDLFGCQGPRYFPQHGISNFADLEKHFCELSHFPVLFVMMFYRRLAT